MPLVTLTTDFGTDSPYVAQMKGRLLTLCPGLTIVDVTHAIPPQDVRRGALALADCVSFFPDETLHIAVVDPGVGTERRLVYAHCGTHNFLAPDNGLLELVAQRWPPRRIVALENRAYWADYVAPTFHGRDILAPVAARLACGLDPLLLGRECTSLMSLHWPVPRIEPRRITGEVVSVDSFGNLVTNIDESMLTEASRAAAVHIVCSGHAVSGLVRTYAERPPGAIVALIGSSGRFEVAQVQGSAARSLAVATGAAVEIAW